MELSQLRALVEVRQRGRNGSAKAIRIAAGLTIAEVAAAVGVGESTVSRWEGGSRQPRGEAALRWAALLTELSTAQRDAA